MYKVHIDNKLSFFKFLSAAKEFAKLAGVWYYITDEYEVVYTQDDEIFEVLNSNSH